MKPSTRYLLALLALIAGTSAFGQQFPTKPVRIIVAFPAGGGTDIVARTMGAKLSEFLGQQVIVDNRAGAAGIVGTDIAAKSPPDGHTMFMGTLGNLSVNPLFYAKLPFDVARDFAPLTQAVNVTFMLYSHPSFPVKTAKDLIAIAKTRQVNYGSSGVGGAAHLAAELFNSMAGVKTIHIAYKGSGPSFIDLLGGQIPIVFDSLVQGLQYVKGGKLRAVATLGPTRSPVLPDVPTMGETLPGYSFVNWFGIVVPAGTPRDVIARLHTDVVKVLRTPEIKERLISQGAEPVGNTPEQFGAFMRSETAKWAKLIKEADIRAE